jgi:hypothetical protein
MEIATGKAAAVLSRRRRCLYLVSSVFGIANCNFPAHKNGLLDFNNNFIG